MSQAINFVNFNSNPIMTVTDSQTGIVYIPCKPICEAIGILWHGQLEKIKQDEVLSSVIQECCITASDGKDYKTTCIPLDYINGWLFKLNPSKVAPEVKDRVIMYQRECYAVLAKHFQKQDDQPKQLPYTPTQLAKIAIDDLSYIAEKFEVPKSFATQEIAKLATRLSGVDITSLLTQSVHMDKVPNKDVMLEPTELGKHYGLSGKAMNNKLMDLDLQYRDKEGWKPTEKGEPLCEKHAWVVKNKSGYNLKWNWQGVDELMQNNAL